MAQTARASLECQGTDVVCFSRLHNTGSLNLLAFWRGITSDLGVATLVQEVWQ
jgi:hypothetical protein